MTAAVFTVSAQEEARRKIDSLRRLLPAAGGEERAGLYKELSIGYQMLNDPQEGSAFFSEYLREAHRLNDPALEGSALSAKMSFLKNSNQFDSIRLQRKDALEFLERNGQWDKYYSVWQNWTESLLMQGHVEEMLQGSEQMYEKARQQESALGMGVTLMDMSHAYFSLGRKEDAFQAIYDAVQMLKKGGVPKFLFQAYENLVYKYGNVGEYEKALALCREYEKELNEAERASQTPDQYAPAWFNMYYAMAWAYSDLGRYDESEACLRLAERNPVGHDEKSKNRIRQARAQNYLYTDHYLEAVQIMDTLYNSLMGSGDVRAANIILGDKAWVAYDAGYYEIAAEAYRDFIGQNDSLRTVADAARLDELRTRYEVDKITAQKEANRNYMFLALAGCVFLLAALCVWIVYSRRLAARNRGLVERIREQDRAEEQYAVMLQENARLRALTQPAASEDEQAGQEDALFVALRSLMKEEKLYTDPDLTRRTVAERLGTNEVYLHEAVKRNTGLAFMEYINSLRLFNAREMLSDRASRYTIEAVAIDSGFGSTRTFYRLFRRNYGLTPEEFRRLSIM